MIDRPSARFEIETDIALISSGTSGTNTGDETTARIGVLINGSAAATPNNTDLVATAESSVLKKITWTNVKAFLKTYFDTLYQVLLVSGTNIKTVNSSSLLGAGDLVVSGNITIGNPITSGTNNRFLYQNSSGNVAESNGAQYDGTTATFSDLAAPTTNLTDDTNKRFVTDANLTTIGNQSGTNTGDQTDATLPFTDITTNNASTSKHGFLKKLSNVSTEFMNGTGAWSTPATNITETEVDFGTAINQIDKSFTVTDASVTTGSQLLANIAYKSPSDGRSIDEIAAEEIDIFCAPGTGQFTMLLRSRSGSVAGKFLVNYSTG